MKIVASLKSKQLSKFLDAHRDVAAHLTKRSSEDQAYDVSICHFLGEFIFEQNISRAPES